MKMDQFIKYLDNEGTAKHMSDSDFDKDELKLGIKIEREHSDNRDIAKEIAKDHLAEIPDYYTRLVKMEAEAKKKLNLKEK